MHNNAKYKLRLLLKIVYSNVVSCWYYYNVKKISECLNAYFISVYHDGKATIT